MLRNFFVAVPIAALAIGGSACASKKFVRTSVGEVNEKVDSLGRSVEETQERTRRNEGRISEVDQKAQARGGGEGLLLRQVQAPAEKENGDRLRRQKAGGSEQDQGGPRAEPPRRHQGSRLKAVAPRPRAESPATLPAGSPSGSSCLES